MKARTCYEGSTYMTLLWLDQQQNQEDKKNRKRGDHH